MSFFSRLFGPKDQPDPALWPNKPSWSALKHEVSIETEAGSQFLWTIACGDLALPSGRLVACDPFVCLQPTGTPFIVTPKGTFPVTVTLVDVSEEQDRSHIREAYASIIFAEGVEAYRKAIPLARDGEERPEPEGEEFIGFPVDAGTACFVDESVIASCMPDPDDWGTEVFENDRPDCWFNRMDDPAHIREGLANITLPLAKNGENIVIIHSGWGDGHFPVVGSFDASGRLLAAHIDFQVVG
jgi:hypothetical protein